MTVSDIVVYPVKSLRGVSLTETSVGPRGLHHDRRWMIVDETGKFRTQRQLPQMAQLGLRLREAMTILAEDGRELELPLSHEGSPMEVTVWNYTGRANRVSDEADRWLSDVLGMPCHLVAMPDSGDRVLSSSLGYENAPLAFSDACPILVASEESLQALNALLVEPVPMDRFRANIIVRGATPYAEDEWSSFVAGSATLTALKRCGRCLVTTTDQQTGARHPEGEPLKTLAKERLFGNSACFGMYYLASTPGQIQVGDEVQPLAR